MSAFYLFSSFFLVGHERYFKVVKLGGKEKLVTKCLQSNIWKRSKLFLAVLPYAMK